MSTLSTSKMTIGESVVMEITDVVQGRYGPVFIAKVNGEQTEVRPSGNLKFLVDDLSNGKKKVNTPYRVTRTEDYKGFSKVANKAYTSSQFQIEEIIDEPVTEAPKAAPTVAEKLAQIRAKAKA